jgi:hypothetical protein
MLSLRASRVCSFIMIVAIIVARVAAFVVDFRQRGLERKWH